MKRARKSWQEEHEGFAELMKNQKISEKWTLGFYQIIHDPVPPTTKLKDNSLEEFLVPESHLSLKLFFDNLRNYGICAALLIFSGLILNKSSYILLPSTFPDWLYTTIAASALVMSGGLLILNGLQTWFLLTELLDSVRSIQIAKSRIYRGGNFIRFILSIIHIVATWVIDIIVVKSTIVFALVVLLIPVGFAVHSVLSSSALR